MEKHIRKTFLWEQKMSPEQLANPSFDQIDISEEIKSTTVKQDYNAFLVTDSGNVIKGFVFNDSGRAVIIPEPDPVKILFDSAYLNYLQIKKSRPELLSYFKGKPQDENYVIALYNYYSYVNAFSIMLFTSLEAFINSNIPNDYKYIVDGDRRTEIYSKAQAMELPFNVKINKVLTEIFQKDFVRSHGIKYQHIVNLKEFRDSIVHLKPDKANAQSYSEIYKRGLKFKFEESLDAVMDFMNFYKPGMLEYCPCANNF